MKKLLSILGAVSLTATGTIAVVACNKKEETNLLDEVATEKYYNDLANYIILKEYFTANPSGSLVIDKKISNVKEIVKIEINYENKINDIINLNTISNLITDNFNFIVPKIFQKILINNIKENLINIAKELNIEIKNNIINFQNISLEKNSSKQNNIVILNWKNTIDINLWKINANFILENNNSVYKFNINNLKFINYEIM